MTTGASAAVMPMRTAGTLKQPEAKPARAGKYTEVSWFFHDRTIILSGLVDGDEVRCLSAEDGETGDPFKIPDAFIVDALHDLIEAAGLSS